MNAYLINEALACKVRDVVKQGLCGGLGKPKPGQMCVEAAVNYAMGLPHGDYPPCVGEAVRSAKIRLNDASWSSNEARAEGMLAVAIAQLGSNEIDQRAFATHYAELTIRKVLPIALRDVAKKNPAYADSLEAMAVECEQKGTREAALRAKEAAAYAAYAAANAAANAAAYADLILRTSADCLLEALKRCNSPGCAYLYLLESK